MIYQKYTFTYYPEFLTIATAYHPHKKHFNSFKKLLLDHERIVARKRFMLKYCSNENPY
jgi:hypothetical protein